MFQPCYSVFAVALCLSAIAQPMPGSPLSGLAGLKPGDTMRASSSDANWENGNADARPIAPGKTLVIADLEGPGMIRHIWNTVAAEERGYSRLLVIRMYWDGEETPSVEVPLGDFFVIGNGMDKAMQSIPVVNSSEGRARNCYWPMPFHKSAKITLTNEGSAFVRAFYWYVDWQKLPELAEDSAYFHATYRQEYPTKMGQNYLIADIEGRGHYVGTVMNIRQHAASWYGEGDDFFFIDGEEKPRLRGTGSEDYFCDAWGYREFDGPYYGVPVWGDYKPMSKFTMYRWHLADPVNFHTSLRVEIEHKGVTFNEDGSVKSGFEEREDDFASVAYWYQLEPHKPFAPLPDPYDRLFYDWRKMKQAEDLIEGARATLGEVQVQEGVGTGKGQLFWLPNEEGHRLEIPVEVPETGTLELLLTLTKSWDYGIYQVLFDGTPLGNPVDLFNKDAVTREDFTFDAGEVKAGTHTLAFLNKGRNPSSQGIDGANPGYYFGFDAYLLTVR